MEIGFYATYLIMLYTYSNQKYEKYCTDYAEVDEEVQTQITSINTINKALHTNIHIT